MKRIYAIKYYDIGVMDYSSVMYESVEEAYKEVHKLGFTERLGFLYYRHETRKFETVEIEIFKFKKEEINNLVKNENVGARDALVMMLFASGGC